MSSGPSPAHRISGDFDSVYDPNFTAEISNKMRVPHKLLVTGGSNAATTIKYPVDSNGADKVAMRVPDRIVVAGEERHIEQRAPPRELRLEQVINLPPTIDPIRVETPPRVLSLEDHYFPTVNDSEEEEASNGGAAKSSSHDSAIASFDDNLNKVADTPSGLMNRSMDESSLSPAGELLVLRRQFLKLNRRMLLLEQENQMRQQRDTLIYSLAVAYGVVKILMWLNRNW